ncbi:MAG TPA: LamG-like jellyroll fold domain-containing protein, partial [Polyangiaceae bacterium]
TIQTPLPGFGSWHFYRMVRDTGAGEVRFCIDGQLKGKAPLSGTIDISARISARMGMFNNFSARAQFNGAIDDIRIFRRLLPCG